MRMLTNPACLFTLLLLIMLLLVATALVSRSRTTRAQAQPKRLPSPRLREIVATAPLEALAALQERLAEVQRHLPPGSDDAHWLEAYIHDLRNVADDLYWELYRAAEDHRAQLLERLGVEVARLDQAIGQHIGATLTHTTDRDVLYTQLDQVRRAVDEHDA